MDIDKDLEALLGLSTEEPVEDEAIPLLLTAVEEETVEQKEIRVLKDQLTRIALAPQDDEGRPVSEQELTPEQKEIRMLRDQLARKQARDFDTMKEVEIVAPEVGNIIHIHFIGDKVTALGRQWYRGQQIRFEVGSQAYKDTQDRYGYSWLSMTDEDQVNRWGDVMFRRGPWPGKDYEDPQATQAEKNRKMAAPTLMRTMVPGDAAPRKFGV